MAELTTGDDVAMPATLRKKKTTNGVVSRITFVINSSATITAKLISIKKDVIVLDEFDVPESNAGSDWANSLIVVEIPSLSSSTITIFGKVYLEVQVDDGGKKTWFETIEILEGTIA